MSVRGHEHQSAGGALPRTESSAIRAGRGPWALALALLVTACGLEIPAAQPQQQTTEDTGVGSGDTRQDVAADDDQQSTPTCQCGAPFCKTEGLCKASQPVCEQGEDGTCAWNCDYPASYVEAEGDADCDGEDNDCDGVTDDIPDRASDSLNCGQGVCAGAPSRCMAGSWVCEEAGVAGFEPTE